ALLEAYDRYKEVRALLDYDDLILTSRRLLDDQAGWVLYKLDGGLDHLLIDEAQDTSAEQWAIARSLTAEFFAGLSRRDEQEPECIRTVFAVGDRKQSIYSFQGAAPDHFDSMRALLRNRATAVGRSWADVPLNISFRSTPAVLAAVDAVFARDPARDGVVLAGEEMSHIAFRTGAAGLVEIWPPVEPALENPQPPWKPPIERITGDAPSTRLAQALARRIAAMVGASPGERVGASPGEGDWLASRQRPVRAGDIMVLVRRRGSFVEDLVRLLKSLNVPVAGVDRMVLKEQMAVMDLMALGAFLLLPEDDLTLAVVLKSPLIGLEEDDLFALAHPRGHKSLWRALQNHAGASTPFGQAHALLAELLAMVDYRRPHELYATVLGPLDGRRRLVARLGPDAEDALDEFLTLTLRYETHHTPSLQGFLHWLETTRAEVKRNLDQSGVDAVRILTVHNAKGLQAPIVFLPDTLQAPDRTPSLLWEEGEEGLMFWPPSHQAPENPWCASLREAAKHARDREYRRLLYVAMTRAEDRLYVCGWHTQKAPPPACWYTLIRTALEPLGTVETDPLLAALTPSLLPAAEVLRLRSTSDESTGAAARELPLAPVRLPPPPWAVMPPPREPAPPRPLAPSRPDDREPPVHAPARSEARFRRGRLVHRLLQSLPLVPAEQREAAARRYLDHAGADLTSLARAALAKEVLAVLDHPAMAPLFGLNAQAEVPVVGLVGARVVSGQVDRLVVTENAVIIADYKTNRPPPQRTEDVARFYLQQMAAYRAVLETIYPGRRVDCVLVWTDRLPDENLSVSFVSRYTKETYRRFWMIMSADSRAFCRAMACFASGVTVMTTTAANGQERGMTVSAFSALSLDPPLVLVCLDRQTLHLQDFLTGTFAVNILRENQKEVSIQFATRNGDRWGETGHTIGETGAPLLNGCLATIECDVETTYPGGDHVIVVGRVRVLSSTQGGQPLVYFRSAYAELGRAL
ncbi:MAG: ATP-dependent exoDNAse beta subunit, partial [bacterium]